jgi:hypothetical protein
LRSDADAVPGLANAAFEDVFDASSAAICAILRSFPLNEKADVRAVTFQPGR